MKEQTKAAEKAPDTFDAPKKRRGRPPSGSALSNKERQAKYRKSRVLLEVGSRMAATVGKLAAEFDLTESEVTAHLVRFALCNRNWWQTGFGG